MSTPASIAKHPIHPMLVAFPVGLLVFSLICDLIYAGVDSPTWMTGRLIFHGWWNHRGAARGGSRIHRFSFDPGARNERNRVEAYAYECSGFMLSISSFALTMLFRGPQDWCSQSWEY
jgi:uncharacterized membrane protein